MNLVTVNHMTQVSKTFLLELFRESPDLLHHMTTQISPSLLGGTYIQHNLIVIYIFEFR